MKPLLDAFTMFNHNATKVVLILCAIASCCGCEARPQQVGIGETAPVFSTTAITGEPVSLNQFRGKIVVIYFWQNSCCGDSLKLLEPLYNRHKELAIVAVDVGDTKDERRSNCYHQRDWR